MRIWLFSMILFVVLPFGALSQSYTPMVQPDSLRQTKYFNLPSDTLIDKTSLEIYLAQKVDSLRNQGFFAVSVDSTRIQDEQYFMYAFLGKQYQIEKIANDNVDAELFELHFAKQKELTWQAISTKKKSILQQYTDWGYLNAMIQLQDIQFFKNKINAKLHVEQGEQYVLDSLKLIGDLEIRLDYLTATLGVKQGDALNQSFFDKLTQQVNTSKYMKLSGKPSFKLKPDGKANVYLPLNDKKANEFDLLIGFLPNPNPRLTTNKLLITGEGRLQLFNPFGGGREFFVDYKQLQPESPQMAVDLFLPQFLQTDFGVIGAFDLYKEDTTFVNLNGSFGVRYNLDANKDLSIKYRRAKSYLQDIDTNYVKQTFALPRAVDYTQNSYEAEFNWRNTNRDRNPSRGFKVQTSAGVGSRTITQNESITGLSYQNFDFASLYTGLNKDKLLLQGDLLGQLYLPAFKRSTFLVQNRTGVKDLNRFFDNDMYRLGGFKSIRGFDEQSYLASAYSISTAEYRLLLNQESFFSVFADWAYLDNQATNQDNKLLGIGSGLDLATRAGIFSLNLAVGQEDNSSFDFNKTRLHIGYVNVF